MKRLQKRDAGKKKEAEAIVNVAVGTIVGGIIAGPVGAVAGAAVGALVEKGPSKPQPRKQPNAARPTDDQPASAGKRRERANQKKPAGKGHRRKPRVTIAPPLVGKGPDVRISRATHQSRPPAKGGATLT